jgi:hypothetical protein
VRRNPGTGAFVYFSSCDSLTESSRVRLVVNAKVFENRQSSRSASEAVTIAVSVSRVRRAGCQP